MDARVWLPPGFDPGRLAVRRHRSAGGRVHHVDLLLAELSTRQHGNVARRQLLALGVTAGEIESRLCSGALLTVRRGVYAVGRPVVGPVAWRMAAVLAAGQDAR
ncbi:MAG: hypothetical protein JWM31_2193, partial [Solirubrobacterales bacterium]|nr:hypothetical protein [Solirubrobacterales bacterium]